MSNTRKSLLRLIHTRLDPPQKKPFKRYDLDPGRADGTVGPAECQNAKSVCLYRPRVRLNGGLPGWSQSAREWKAPFSTMDSALPGHQG